MKIEAKVPKGYLIRCGQGSLFLVKALGPSVECPECGETALSTDLATEYHCAMADRRRTGSAAE